jgi:hypothetical protein
LVHVVSHVYISAPKFVTLWKEKVGAAPGRPEALVV